MPSCIVRKCEMAWCKRGEKKKVVLHVFPNDVDRIKAWLQQPGQQYQSLDRLVQCILDDKKKALFRMCSGHFTEDCYEVCGHKKILKSNALPTIFPTRYGEPVIREYILRRSRKRFRTDTRALSQQIPAERLPVSTCTSAVTASTIPRFARHMQEASTQTDFETICNGKGAAVPFKRPQHLEGVPQRTGQARCAMQMHAGDSDYSAQMFESEKSEITIEEAKENNYVNERKFIVFESCLDNLFTRMFCSAQKGCTAPVKRVQKICEGSLLKVTGYCQFGHQFVLWESQPRVNNMAVGDLLSAASMLFSGASFRKVQEQNNIYGLQQMSERTYCRYLVDHLYGIIDNYWKLEQQRLKNERKDEPLCVVGGGQWCSPGNMTKYHIYTMMDINTEEILDVEVTQCTPHTSLLALEKKAIQICLDRLIRKQFNIKVVATDGHASVRKLMSEKYPALLHQFDVWHYSKALEKKLLNISKKKSGRDLVPWIKSILNHFWWSMRTCGSDGKMLYERWTSVLRHITNQHSWQEADQYHECSHPALTAKQQASVRWLNKPSPAYGILYNFVMDAQIKADMDSLVDFWHTGAVEATHSLMRNYRTKQIPFNMDSVEAIAKLGVLAQNNNVQIKPEIATKRGLSSGQSKRIPPNMNKRWVVRMDNKPVSIAHLEVMLQDVLSCC